MDKRKYRKQFARAISFAPKELRIEILAELDAILADPSTNINNLGTPKYLAAQYLQDADCTPTFLQKTYIWLRNGLAIFGIIAFSIIALIFAIMYYYVNYSPFDYTDKEVALTSEDFADEVIIKQPINIINANQANVVFYSHDKDHTLLRCQTDISYNDNIVDIQRNSCLIFLPKGEYIYNGDQSSLFLIEPKSNLTINIKNTNLNFYRGQSKYDIEINRERTRGESFKSDENATVKLIINSFQATFDLYQWE